MKRVYISGKISGLPKSVYEHNFNKACQMLKLAGYKPISPLKIWHPLKFYYGYLFFDLLTLTFCSRIYLMSDWQDSKGAMIEYKWAKFLKKKTINRTFHIEQIICPNCGSIQTAKIEHTPLWNMYVHDCTECGYTIMESEWERVTNDK